MPVADGARAVGHRGRLTRGRSLFVTVVPLFLGLVRFSARAAVGGIFVVTVPPVARRSVRNRADEAENQQETESWEQSFHCTPLISTFSNTRSRRGTTVRKGK